MKRKKKMPISKQNKKNRRGEIYRPHKVWLKHKNLVKNAIQVLKSDEKKKETSE